MIGELTFMVVNSSQSIAEQFVEDMAEDSLLPSSVAAVIDRAVASGDTAGIDAVARYARQAYPQAADAIERRISLRRNMVGLVALATRPVLPKTVPKDALQNETAVAPLAQLPIRWSGEGEIGAFTSSGNAPGIGFVGAIKLLIEGDNWRVNSLGRIDYQENASVITRNQYRISAEPNYKFDARGYVFGLGQYEKDRFQGFQSRYSLSGGLGYSVFAKPDAKVNVKAGPAWRRTTAISGEQETILAGLASFDVNVALTPSLKFSQDASAYFNAGGSTLYSLAALDTKLSEKLKVRFSYLVQHETTPEQSRRATDETSRFTLVYGF